MIITKGFKGHTVTLTIHEDTQVRVMVDKSVESYREEYQKLLWDAALESMGPDTVRARLNNMPTDRSATFKLPGQRSCKRGYAEDWLGRGDAKEKALEVRQHRDLVWIAVLTVALGIVAAVAVVATAWPVVRGWIK